jgi:nucleotidyltransferase substrate binding protein (TIGR01987 family)
MTENYLLQDFKKTIDNLDEVLNMKEENIVRDAAMKRFDLCFDTAWKLVKNLAKKEGIECYSPRQCFKVGFQLKLLGHDSEWVDMLEDRNLSAHLYKEEEAIKIYTRLPEYLKSFKKLLIEAEK